MSGWNCLIAKIPALSTEDDQHLSFISSVSVSRSTSIGPIWSLCSLNCLWNAHWDFNASGSAWLPDEGPTLQQQTIIKCKKIPSCCAFCRRLKVVVLARGTPGDGCYLCPKWPKYTFNLLVFVLPCPERRDLNGNHMVTGRTFICGNASNWFLFYANKRIDYRALLWFLQLVLFSAQSSFLLVWHWFIFHLKWPGMRIECTIEYFFARWLRLIYPMYHLPKQWP